MKKSVLSMILCALFLSGCREKSSVLSKIDQIKMIGNRDIELAIAMHDSLTHTIRKENTYTQMKYDLLSVRLHDKADILPHSDIDIRRLLGYFIANGSGAEKQEVLYYAGSVYRDLKDTPRALDYFLKSAEIEANPERDSLLLRNTYSQLAHLYSNVQDYIQSLKMAQMEYKLTCALSLPTQVPLCHIANAYLRIDSLSKAEETYDRILQIYMNSKIQQPDMQVLQDALCGYCLTENHKKAKECFNLIQSNAGNCDSEIDLFTMGLFYNLVSENDSAINCFKKVTEGDNLFATYDALKYLITIYNQKGDLNSASDYSLQLVSVIDSLDLGLRQELSATVRNEHQYHKDKEEERRMIQENAEYHLLVWIVSSCSIIALLLLLTAYINKKKQNLKKTLSLTEDLKDANSLNIKLQEDLGKRQSEINRTKNALMLKDEELDSIKMELTRSDEELKVKSQELEERLRQNKQFIRLLHQSEFEKKAEDIILAIRKAAEGTHNLTSSEISQLVVSVDEIYPNFRDRMVQRLGKYTQKQELVCYLMKIGLSNAHIQNLTNIPKVTIWRWTRKYGEIFADEFGMKL